MDYDEARAIAKENPGAVVNRNKDGSFQVRFANGKTADNVVEKIEEKYFQENQNFKRKVESSNSEIKNLKATVEEKTKESLKLSTKINELLTDHKTLTSALKRKNEEIESLKCRVSEMEENRKNLIKEKGQILSENEEIKYIIDQLDPEMVSAAKKKGLLIQIQKLRENGLQKSPLDVLKKLKNQASTSELPESMIDDLDKIIRLKEKANRPFAAVVGNLKTPEAVDPFSWRGGSMPGDQ